MSNICKNKEGLHESLHLISQQSGTIFGYLITPLVRIYSLLYTIRSSILPPEIESGKNTTVKLTKRIYKLHKSNTEHKIYHFFVNVQSSGIFIGNNSAC